MGQRIHGAEGARAPRTKSNFFKFEDEYLCISIKTARRNATYTSKTVQNEDSELSVLSRLLTMPGLF